MNRQQKETAISDFKDLLTQSKAAFLVNYQGLDVSLMQQLRKSMRDDKAVLKVTKATLMRIAAKDVPGADHFADCFKEQVGMVFTLGDVSSVAKKLTNFSKQHAALKVLSGFYDARLLSAQEVSYLASLPSREILLAHVCGTVQAPIASFVRILNLLIVRLLFVLKQIEEKQARG